MLAVQLIIMLIGGGIAAAIASSKGRSVVGFFFFGFFMPLVGIIVAACLSNLNQEDDDRRRLSQERRRLQEQLRQEKLKNEAFRRHTYGRLDAHDRVLGVSTREHPELLGGPGGTAPAALPDGAPGRVAADAPAPEAAADAWYYESSGTTRGPISLADLEGEIAAGRVRGGTLVWTESLGDWTPAGRVTALRRLLNT